MDKDGKPSCFDVVCEHPNDHKMYNVIGVPCGCLSQFAKDCQKSRENMERAFMYGSTAVPKSPGIPYYPIELKDE